MESDELYQNGENIFRLLVIKNEKILVINCKKRSMPKWENADFLNGYSLISEENLLKELNVELKKYEELNQTEKKIAHDRYGSISLIIPFIQDEYTRNGMLNICSEKLGLSKNTLRKRLQDYLIFQNLSIFVKKNKPKELTQDQRNFRYSLNKFYYTGLQLSLVQSYRKMIEEKYTDNNGKIVDKIPSFRQYSYFFHKTKKMSNYIISRQGMGEYKRNFKPLLGNANDYINSVGYYELDSTLMDIFILYNNEPIRPILTLAVDSYSKLIVGYYLGLKGGCFSLEKLFVNCLENKVEHCRKFGIEITNEEWPTANGLAHYLITDNGKEFTSSMLENFTKVGIQIDHLSPYSPQLKGSVESAFHSLQSSFKKELAKSGVIFPDYQERGGIDYKKYATLSLDELNKILLYCIIHHNSSRIIKVPSGSIGIEPFPSTLFLHSYKSHRNNFVPIDNETIHLLFLPTTKGYFTRKGLKVGNLVYRHPNYVEEFLSGGEAVISYDKCDSSFVYLNDNCKFVKFELIDKFFNKMSLEKADELIAMRKAIEKENKEIELQGKINLSEQIVQIRNANKIIKDKK